MKETKNITDNSILTTLATIHATILSIIFAIMIVFFFYSYQIIDNLTEKLNDLRYQVGQIMSSSDYHQSGNTNISEYIKNGTVDVGKIRSALFHLVPANIPNASVQTYEGVIKKRGSMLLDLISLLSRTYPYSESSSFSDKGFKNLSFTSKRIKYDKTWGEDFISLNRYLNWLWETQKPKILDLMSKFEVQYNKEQLEKIKSKQAKVLMQKLKIDINFKQIVESFFQKVEFFERNIVPSLREETVKLNLYQNKFKIKEKLSQVIVLSIIILFLGIFLPLFIHLYIKPPYLKHLQMGLLIITTLPYFCFLFLYLSRILKFKMP